MNASSSHMNISDEQQSKSSMSARTRQKSRQTFSLTERVGVVAAGTLAWMVQLLFKIGLLRRK